MNSGIRIIYHIKMDIHFEVVLTIKFNSVINITDYAFFKTVCITHYKNI